jgi:type VI secretion system protein VasG
MVPVAVDARAVASVISAWTGIPAGEMQLDEVRAVLALEEKMAERIVGQPQALDAIARRIRTSRAKLDDPGKPIGVFLLVGPSGVGKTETALTLAEILYGGERSLVVVNMSEFQEAHTVSTLKGAPPGYVGYGSGGVLTEAVRRRPYSVILLDEMEKAHPDVAEVFYQVFDKGTLEDGEGVVVDFKNTVILMTSNAGAEVISRLCRENGERGAGGPAGNAARPEAERLAEEVRPALLAHFKPAFLGRLVTVPYYPLGDEQIREIVELKLAKVRQRVRDSHRAELTYGEELVDAIATRCTEVDSGARNIDHILTQSLLPELASALLGRIALGEGFSGVHVSAGDSPGGAFVYTVRG